MRYSCQSVSLAFYALHCTVQISAVVPFRRNATLDGTTPSQRKHTAHLPVAAQTSEAASRNASIYEKLPGLWFEACLEDGGPPCTAYCHKNDTLCQEVGNAAVSTCQDLWDTYMADSYKTSNPAPGWSTLYKTYGQTRSLSSTTVDVYTTFSTASVAVVKQNVHTNATNYQVTITPVYALGQPTPSVSMITLSQWSETASWLTAPTPSCRYTALSTSQTSQNCGKCSIHGGSVELYFWPPATSTDTERSLITTRSTVLTEGVTLYSPTVYISLSTVYASNSCTQVGKNHTGTLLAMKPTDVSTQVHWGGKVGASGAYYFDRINYADLTGLPPVTDFENQPSCIMFGCSTIFPTFNPTLVVPLALRTLVPEWSSCEAALEGLYDPPIALTEQAVMAAPTMPSQNTGGDVTATTGPKHVEATQCSAPKTSTAIRTNAPKSTIAAGENGLASDLASFLADGQGPSHDPTPSISASSSGKLESQTSSRSNELPSDGSFTYTETTKSIGFADTINSTPTTKTQLSNEHTTDLDGHIASILSLIQQDTTFSSQGAYSTSNGYAVANTSPNTTPPSIAVQNTLSVAPTSSTESTTLKSSPATTDSVSHPHHPPTVSQDHEGNFIINGKTLAPGSPITLANGDSPMTVHMDTLSDGETLVKVGTTRTATLDPSTSRSILSNRTSKEQSTSNVLPSLVSYESSVTTSEIEYSETSMSSAQRNRMPALALITAFLAMGVCVVL